jgi:GT2 family glycosyltransferase
LKDLSIIIVNYRLKEDTAACVESLMQAGAGIEQMVIVDNHSADGSVEYLHTHFGQALSVLELADNRGYAAGLNAGIRQRLEGNSAWFLLMNNDTIVTPDFLSKLDEVVCQDQKFSLIGPMILLYDKPDTVWFLGGKFLKGTMIGYHPYRFRKEPAGLPELIPVDYIHGCTMLVRKNVFQQAGLFNDASLLFAEEADFCWRARQAGFRIAAAPHARMFHKVSASTKLVFGQQNPKTWYLRICNQTRFYSNYSHGLMRGIMASFSLLRALSFAIYFSLNKQKEMASASMNGWRDGWYKNIYPGKS